MLVRGKLELGEGERGGFLVYGVGRGQTGGCEAGHVGNKQEGIVHASYDAFHVTYKPDQPGQEPTATALDVVPRLCLDSLGWRCMKAARPGQAAL